MPAGGGYWGLHFMYYIVSIVLYEFYVIIASYSPRYVYMHDPRICIPIYPLQRKIVAWELRLAASTTEQFRHLI
jgi:hypothetical protein